MFEQTARDSGTSVNDRLAWLTAQLTADESTVGPGGRLVRRWLPAGPDGRARRRFVLAAVAVVVAGVIFAAVALTGGHPAAEPAPALPAAAASPAAAPTSAAGLVISIVGKVRSPGLFTLPAGARVADALRAAGGPVPGTDLSALNLARKLADGEQLAVGVPAAPAPAGSGAPGAKVDLNAATTDQLDTLPGVGEVMAKRIVQWRTDHGGFTSVEQLRDISGIGESKFSKLRDQVSVG